MTFRVTYRQETGSYWLLEKDLPDSCMQARVADAIDKPISTSAVFRLYRRARNHIRAIVWASF